MLVTGNVFAKKSAMTARFRPKTNSNSNKFDNKSNNGSSNSKNKSNGSTNNNNNGNNNKSAKPSTSGASASSANPIADKLGKDGKLHADERQRRFDNNICLYCGGTGHKTADCKKAAASKTKARTAQVQDKDKDSSKKV